MNINETEPKYFKEFREQLENHEPKYFKEFRKEVNDRFDKVDKKIDVIDKDLKEVIRKQDIHFEAIGEIKIQLTTVEEGLGLKTNRTHHDLLENRVEKIETVVFA